MIRIYADEGASGVPEMMTWASDVFNSTSAVIQASEIREEGLNGDILIMPGGRDIPYVEKLGNEGQAYIRQHVEDGGLYVGICAGAYFATAHVDWEVGREGWEVSQSRSLRFFPDLSRGVYFPVPLYHGAPAEVLAVEVVPVASEEFPGMPLEPFMCWFHGGGTFLRSSSTEGERVQLQTAEPETTSTCHT